jgi:hypothetical protein
VCEATAKGGTPGKPGWSYFCTRYADTKILLAHATWFFLRQSRKKMCQDDQHNRKKVNADTLG